MTKIELYYNKENDCIQMVENGKLRFHDEGVSSCDFLTSFGDNVHYPEDLKHVAIENVIKGYLGILGDIYQILSEDEAEAYFKTVATEKIQGEIIFSGEFETPEAIYGCHMQGEHCYWECTKCTYISWCGVPSMFQIKAIGRHIVDHKDKRTFVLIYGQAGAYSKYDFDFTCRIFERYINHSTELLIRMLADLSN